MGSSVDGVNSDQCFPQLEAPDVRAEDTRQPAWRWSYGAVAGAYALSRLVALAVGVRTEADHLSGGWQLLDLTWLRDDLLGSIWHLHSQPPLHNLFFGVLTHVAPGREAGLAFLVHVLLGLLAALALLDLLRRLGSPRALAVTVTLLALLSPAAVLYEHYLIYMSALAYVLVLASWGLCRFADKPTWPNAVLMWGLVAVPALTWGAFHLIWVAAVGVAITWPLLRGERKTAAHRAIAIGCIALALTGGWYAKNLVQHGQFTSSTWVGKNLYRVATAELDDAALRTLVEQGRVPEIALVDEFSPLAQYDVPPRPPAGRPSLDEPRKTDGTPNYNNLAYVGVSAEYLDAAIRIMRARPDAYATAVVKGTCRFFKPASDYWFVRNNRDRIAAADRLYNLIVYGQWRTPHLGTGCLIVHAPDQFAFFLPLLYGGALVVSGGWALRRTEDPAARAVLGFIAVTLLWMLAAGNLFEHGENNRFRFVTEPLMWLPLGLLATRLSVAFRRRTRPGEPSDFQEVE